MDIQDEVQKAFDAAYAKAEKESKEPDGIILYGGATVNNVMMPDKDAKLEIASGMDKMLSYVMGKMKNSRVYVHLRTDPSRFVADFFVITTVGKAHHTGQYITSWLAIGMNDEQVTREGDIICKSLATSLGRRIFIDDAPVIPIGAMEIKDLPK